MKVTRSSLFPTAIVLPSGDHVILIFSPGEGGKIINRKTVLKWFQTLSSKDFNGDVEEPSGFLTAGMS
jgi:hypothetical protein